VRVLIVEDEPELAAVLARVLDRSGFAVDVAATLADGARLCAARSYDAIILDRRLPDGSGDALCRAHAADGYGAKILMPTARDAVADRVEGLDLGADDYVVKPVAMAELLARVRALVRRRGEIRPPVLRRHDLVVDSAARTVARAGRRIDLNRKERAVLEELLRADGATVSTDRLLNAAWGDAHGYPFDNTVRVTIMRLRRKLGPPALIETVIGEGYRLP
jgi:DNA-binding response OmpR family regulator